MNGLLRSFALVALGFLAAAVIDTPFTSAQPVQNAPSAASASAPAQSQQGSPATSAPASSVVSPGTPSPSLSAYGPVLAAVLAAVATALAAILSLYGVLRVNRRTLAAQDATLAAQLSAQQDQLVQQLNAQRDQFERQLVAQREQFNQQEASAAKQKGQEAAQAVYRELLVAIGSALHSACWITWVAMEGPERISQERIDAYDLEMHEVLAKIMGFQASLTALNSKLSDGVSPLLNELFALDAHLGRAGLLFAKDPARSTTALAALYSQSTDLERRLMTGSIASNAVAQAVPPPAAPEEAEAASTALPGRHGEDAEAPAPERCGRGTG
jgi:hypothetical protein